MKEKINVEADFYPNCASDAPPEVSASNSNDLLCSDDTKQEMFEAIRAAETCAYDYAASCDLGDERIWAFEVFERIRNSTRS